MVLFLGEKYAGLFSLVTISIFGTPLKLLPIELTTLSKISRVFFSA